MKIILTTMPKEGCAVQWVTPKYFQLDNSKYVPLGLLSLATNIPEGNDVRIIDAFSKNLSIDDTIEKIEKEKPDILGLSVTTFGAYPMTEILKKTSALYKVVGGPHTKHNSQDILNQKADAVFVGPLADHEFALSIEEKPKGIIKCNTGINEIKFPDRKFIDNEFYYPKGNLFESNKRMPMFSGIGCHNRCTFCDVQTKEIVRKTPGSIIDEMFYLKSLGAGSIHIYEDNFNTDENYLKKVNNEMNRRGFHSEWSGRGQAKMSLDCAKMLSENGFKRIHVGFESLSNETLKFFKKPQNYRQIQKFCDTMNKCSIDMVGFFITGAPTETEEDRRTMAPKIKELGIKYPLLSILQPLPRTRYYNDLLEEGIYKKDYWGDYIKNPIANFMMPFPYGREKWQRDADFVEEFIKEFFKT